MKQKTKDYLEANQVETSPLWRKEAEWRRENAKWLMHSGKIAALVLLKMKQEKLTQTALAERMGCTQQYISKILKGTENLTLDIISKLEESLDLRIVVCGNNESFPQMVAEDRTVYEISKRNY